MYWNNPIIEIKYPSAHDPIRDSFHNGKHCLFYNPHLPKDQIHYAQTLQDICNWANNNIRDHGVDEFINNQRNHYDIANLVKLNMWIDDIKQHGIVKPMLITHTGNKKYNTDPHGSGTGGSRLRALEQIPEIQTVSAFITTSVEFKDQFAELIEVTTFDQFAQLCKAVNGQTFLFRLTNPQSMYGLDWYEYDSQQTSSVTPGEEYCVNAVTAYLKQHPETVFTVDWFSNLVNWKEYYE